MGILRRAILVASAFIWLSGCAVGPDYDPPAVTVPKAFGTASLSPALGGLTRLCPVVAGPA